MEYVGVVKKKEEARAQFQSAQASVRTSFILDNYVICLLILQGINAGLVENTQRETHWFKISLNIESFNSVTFVLRYQQLLTRRLGQYEQIIFTDPEKVKP